MESYHNRKIQIGIIAAPSTRYWNRPHVLVNFFSEGRSPPAYYTQGRGYYLTVVSSRSATRLLFFLFRGQSIKQLFSVRFELSSFLQGRPRSEDMGQATSLRNSFSPDAFPRGLLIALNAPQMHLSLLVLS